MVERKNTVEVFVMADSVSVRRKLLRLCNNDPGVDLVGISGISSDIPDAAVASEPDIFLLHLEFQKEEELDLVRSIARRLPQSKIIYLAGPDARRRGARAVHHRTTDTFIAPDDDQQLRVAFRKSLHEKIGEEGAPHRARPHCEAEYQYESIDPQSPMQEEKTHGLVRQISERRQKLAGRRRAEIQQMEANSRFQSLIEQLPGMPYIARLDNSGSTIYVSPKIKELLGFSPEQWCSDPELRIRQLHAEDRPRLQQAIAAAIAGNGEYNIDYRIFGRDGRMHWFHDEARVMADAAGKPVFLQGAALDITERKQAQLELERSHAELQELIDALDTLRIEEQKRLAHEMHDDIGQLLTAMKMDLISLSRYLPQDDSHVTKHLGSINQLVDAMVTSVRRIIADLPPKTLEDLGFYTAVESLARNFACRHGIPCHVHLPVTEPTLDAKIATAVYRMVQEALNNIAKHAHAQSAEVHIECHDAAMAVRISDNGCGMTTDKLRKHGSFGLIGMRERVTALGGKMTIESRDASGTTIHLFIPLNPTPAPKQEK